MNKGYMITKGTGILLPNHWAKLYCCMHACLSKNNTIVHWCTGLGRAVFLSGWKEVNSTPAPTIGQNILRGSCPQTNLPSLPGERNRFILCNTSVCWFYLSALLRRCTSHSLSWLTVITICFGLKPLLNDNIVNSSGWVANIKTQAGFLPDLNIDVLKRLSAFISVSMWAMCIRDRLMSITSTAIWEQESF